MTDWFNSPGDWAAIAAVVAAVIASARWFVKSMHAYVETIARQLDERTEAIQSGFRNGGNSLTDVSERLARLHRENETANQLIEVKVDHISKRLDDHVRLHDRRRQDVGPPEGMHDRRRED